MPKTGKNPNLNDDDLEILGIVICKISARVTQLMDKYPPKISFKYFLKKASSRRFNLTLRLLNEFATDPKFRENNNYNRSLRQLLRELSHSTPFDEADLVSSWGNKGKGLSTKEETIIMHSLTERGIAENIIGKKKIEEITGQRPHEKGGYPSTFRLSHESRRVAQVLSKQGAVEFIINSLSKSQLLFIFYWYVFSSIFYLIRDCRVSEIQRSLAFGKIFNPSYQDHGLIWDVPHMKSLLASMNDQKLLQLTKQLTADVLKTHPSNPSNRMLLMRLLLIIGFFKLNRYLD